MKEERAPGTTEERSRFWLLFALPGGPDLAGCFCKPSLQPDDLLQRVWFLFVAPFACLPTHAFRFKRNPVLRRPAVWTWRLVPGGLVLVVMGLAVGWRHAT